MVPDLRTDSCLVSRSATFMAAALLAIGGPSPAPADFLIDLGELGTTHPGFTIEGANPSDSSGCSVAGAGDINGDGFADLVVGAPQVNLPGAQVAGTSYVIFGKASEGAVNLGSLGSAGFRVTGIDSSDESGSAVSGAGDVNGDGLADILVGAPFADPGGVSRAGESYVVFGKASTGTVSLGTLEPGGFRLDGIDAEDNSGFRLSGAGDVNGDGLADVIVAAFAADPDGKMTAGEAYVVFGRTGTSAVDLDALGSNGFRIEGAVSGDTAGSGVAGAGDVNGDGLSDLIVGARGSSHNGFAAAGQSYVIFGKANGDVVKLEALETGGFGILGVDASDASGSGVAGAGDVNGDGLADLVIGAPTAGAQGRGVVYIVFGKADTGPVNLGDLQGRGFAMVGDGTSAWPGRSVSGAGDVNGDGLSDVIAGAYRSGKVVGLVVYGKTDSTPVALSALGTGGFRMEAGEPNAEMLISSVSGAGDVNRDGLGDLIVGWRYASGSDLYQAGRSYVAFSPAEAPLRQPANIPAAATYRAIAMAGNAPRMAVGTCGDGLEDSQPWSRCWIDFPSGSGPGLAGSSMQTVTLNRSGIAASAELVSARVYWQVSTNRTGWPNAAVTLRYTEAEIGGIAEDTLRLYRASSTAGPWAETIADFDAALNTVRTTVTSLGFFALAGELQIDALEIR